MVDLSIRAFSLSGRIRSKASKLWNTFWTKVYLRLCGCPYGKRLCVSDKPLLMVSRRGQLTFGNNVTLNSRRSVTVSGGNTPVTMHCYANGKIIFGNFSGCSFATLSSRSSITIGNHVMIGANAKIFDHDFHPVATELRRLPNDSDYTATKPVVLEDDAFIGAESLILKGVTIGKGSIVAAGAVVTKSVPPGEIWGGNPARFLRKVEP